MSYTRNSMGMFTSMRSRVVRFCRQALAYILLGVMFTAAVVFAWESVRPGVVALFDSKEQYTPMVFTETVTEYDMWLATADVQHELQLMYKKHKRDMLTAEITDLELKKQ